MGDLESDYSQKQNDLDVLQGEVVKLESIVSSISENVRERTQFSTTITSPSSSATRNGIHATPLFGSPANRLAASANAAASVARQMAEEEDRQFTRSMHVLAAVSPSGRTVAASRLTTPASASSSSVHYSSDQATSVQRSLQTQLDQLEQEVQSLTAERRRQGM